MNSNTTKEGKENMTMKTKSDKEIKPIGFGTWQLKGETAYIAVQNALDIGYRHIDTAQIYGNEESVGKAIIEHDVAREDIWLTTKVWIDKFEPEKLKNSVEESLKKLQTTYADLLLLHWPNEQVPLEKTLQALKEVQEEGKTRFIGISNFTTKHIEKAIKIAPELFTNQVEYHIYLDQSKILQACKQHNMLLTAYSPIAQGKVMEDKTITAIGNKYGKTPIQVALRWLIQQEGVIAIPRSSNKEHQKQNFNIFDFELSSDDIEQLNNLRKDLRLINPGFAPNWD